MPHLVPADELVPMVRAVQAAPDDPTPRLVFADWLQDRDDPRAQLLRLTNAAAVAAAAVPYGAGGAEYRYETLPAGMIHYRQAQPVIVRHLLDPTREVRARYASGRRTGWVRLLSIAYARDLVTGYGDPGAFRTPVRMVQVHLTLARAELYAARLIGSPLATANDRYVFRMAHLGDATLAALLYRLCTGHRGGALMADYGYITGYGRFMIRPHGHMTFQSTDPQVNKYQRCKAAADGFLAAAEAFDHAALSAAETARSGRP